MKYIITERQLRMIAEEETQENIGQLGHIRINIDITDELKKDSTTFYTEDGYPIPSRIKNNTWFNIVDSDGNVVYFGTTFDKISEIRFPTYLGPDNEFYFYKQGENDNGEYYIEYLGHLNKNIVNVSDFVRVLASDKDTIDLYDAFKDGRFKEISILANHDNKAFIEKNIS